MLEVCAKAIWGDFVDLMDRANSKEEHFHQYMAKYPFLIPVWLPIDNKVYSKFRLGSDFVCDFAFARDDSEGFRWTFIEIERPADKLLRKNGDPTSRLTHAVRQLHNWNHWFKENRGWIAQYFPHSERVARFGLADPHLILIIGRREQIDYRNNPFIRDFAGRISIRTFDSLEYHFNSPFLLDEQSSLVCCARNKEKDVEISRMKKETRFFISQ